MEQIKIKLFGNLPELAKNDTAVIEQCADVRTLKQKLNHNYPQFRNATFAIAVNHQVVNDDFKLNPGDEIALLPPFSGG